MTEDEQVLARALSGDRRALEALVKQLTPVIQARAARVLWKHRGAGEPVRQAVNDATQDVFTSLFASEGKVLRDWDPARGLSLRNFVGLVAARQVMSNLRKRSTEAPTAELDDAEALGLGSDTLESRLLETDLVVKLFDRFRAAFSPLGFEVFERLYVRDQSVPEVEKECGLTADAVYQWRSRLRRLARRLLTELETDGEAIAITAASEISR